MAILATLLLAMVPMDMESVMLRLSQRLMPMLSMDHMESTVLDTALILWDMVMAILATVMDMVLAMAVMGMESAMLNQSLMLSMEPMVGMAMDLDTVHTPWDMDRDMVMDLAMVMDMDIMVDQSETTNQERHYNDLVPPPRILVQIYFLVCFIYRLSFHSDHLLCIAKISLVNRP